MNGFLTNLLLDLYFTAAKVTGTRILWLFLWSQNHGSPSQSLGHHVLGWHGTHYVAEDNLELYTFLPKFQASITGLCTRASSEVGMFKQRTLMCCWGWRMPSILGEEHLLSHKPRTQSSEKMSVSGPSHSILNFFLPPPFHPAFAHHREQIRKYCG